MLRSKSAEQLDNGEFEQLDENKDCESVQLLNVLNDGYLGVQREVQNMTNLLSVFRDYQEKYIIF